MHNEKLTLRDQFAASAPITLDQVLVVFGDQDADMQGDNTRTAVNGLWAFLRYEYADAMLNERGKVNGGVVFRNAQTDMQKEIIKKNNDAAIIADGMEALRQIVNEIEDLSGIPAYAKMLRPEEWKEKDNPMYLARRALALYSANVRVEASQVKDTGWIPWDGRGCPVRRDTGIDIKFADGRVVLNTVADSWAWESHEKLKNRIVAYRVVRP